MIAIKQPRRKDPFRVACGITGFAVLVAIIVAMIGNNFLPAPARLPLGSSTNANIPGWKLIFHDEFTTPLNSTIWNTGEDMYHSCCLTFGLQYFTSDALSVNQGVLRIASERRSMAGQDYTSGALATENKFSFRYGRIDIRARMPKGQGMWSALWLTSGNVGQEIDIMEMVNDPTTVYQTYHANDPSYNSYVSQCTVNTQDLSVAFHTYTLVWNTTSVTWYIDGTQTCQLTSHLPQIPMFVMIDTAVGGTWPGPPDDSTVFPQYTFIDYVRIYQATN
jgi:beta-glucanase (GH16 family)